MASFNVAEPIMPQVSSVSFAHLPTDEVRAISVKQVTNPILFDNMNRPTIGGLYDPAFGPLDRGDICKTCGLDSGNCPGHFGHIDLLQPVYHPLYFNQCYQLIRGCCTYCHRFLTTRASVLKFTAKLRLIEAGLVEQAAEIDSYHVENVPGERKRKHVDTDIEMRGGEATGAVEETETAGVESTDSFAQRLQTYVDAQLQTVPKDVTARDEYKKSGLAFDKRKRVINDFLKSLTRKKCEHCTAYAHRFRKDGHSKLMEFSLTAKQEAVHRAHGIRRRTTAALMALSRSDAITPIDAMGHKKRKTANGTAAKPAPSASSSSSSSDDEDEENLMDIDEAARQENQSEDEDPADYDGMVEEGDDDDDDQPKQPRSDRQTERVVPADETWAHLRLVFKREQDVVSLIYAPHGPVSSRSHGRTEPVTPDMFFLDVVSVPPTRFRPASTMGDQVFENPQNGLLQGVLKRTIMLRDHNVRYLETVAALQAKSTLAPETAKALAAESKDAFIRILNDLVLLQDAVNSMIDSTKNPQRLPAGQQPPMGVKQLLEKKEGLFRMNMMGKRVNFAARSVISPDVNIETNEIGVPPVFARKLTFPEPVTAHNVAQLRQAIINGPHEHPGAVMIRYEDGTEKSLERLTIEDRTAEAAKLLVPDSRATAALHAGRPDVGLPQTHTPQIARQVMRHLVDGDIVILNRQPTLHKPSMMCHKVKVLRGEKTIRMHYANCNSYNADFDGDEMNMHFPQDPMAQAEARFIANTDNQYLVPTSGNPLRGLIQDHVVSAVWMTNKDTFFTREEYQQIIYGALRPEGSYSGEGRVKTVWPAIMKPEPLWTGKQIISTLLKNITPPKAEPLNLTSKCKVPGSAWGTHSVEEVVNIVDGDLLTGVLDKSQIGASSYGLVHSVFELYGGEVAGKLLSILSRLLTKFLQHRAFTCRMDDLLLTPEGNKTRRKTLKTVDGKGFDAALDYAGLGGADKKAADLHEDLRTRLEEILRDDVKLAGLDASVESATNQITSGIIKSTLPSGLVKQFPHNHMQMMTTAGAKGSNVNASQISCLLGQQSLEGRRVPVMVSGKTLPSFKAFETAPRAGGFVAGRFLTGIRAQEFYFHCMAGREGLIDTAVKTSRSGYLQRCLIKHLEGLRVHYDNTVRNSDKSILQFQYGEDALDVTKQKHLMQFEFTARNLSTFVNRNHPDKLRNHKNVVELGPHATKAGLKHPESNPPGLSVYSPSNTIGSVSEEFATAVDEYMRKNPHQLIKPKKNQGELPPWVRPQDLITRDGFRTLMYMKYMNSLVDPGEAVGLLASQGIGEPSTQMTLNTFHFAGHGAANVTLGIPRLREIVMTASQDIRTPTMSLPLIVDPDSTVTTHFAQRHTRLTLSEVVDSVRIKERLSRGVNGLRKRKYTVRIEFYSCSDYMSEYNVRPEEILKGIEESFVPVFDKTMQRDIKQNDKELKSQAGETGKPQRTSSRRRQVADAEDEDADETIPKDFDEADAEDGDFDDAKRKAQTGEQTTYSDEEDSDDDSDADSLDAKFKSKKGEDDSDSESDSDREVSEEKEAAQSVAHSMTRMETNCAATSKFIERLSFDRKLGQWCEFDLEFGSKSHKMLLVGIVERSCRAAVIRETPHISRCFVAKAQAGEKQRTLVTEGVNFPAFWTSGFGIVDLNKIYTNDIGSVLHTFGVEAARNAIIQEISAVFKVYGIDVNYRHLSVVADYMTSEGGYKPFNRTGLSNNSSPFLKASFETTANFVSDAALFGDFDDLGSPSANIVLGKTPNSGTGTVFDVLNSIPVAA